MDAGHSQNAPPSPPPVRPPPIPDLPPERPPVLPVLEALVYTVKSLLDPSLPAPESVEAFRLDTAVSNALRGIEERLRDDDPAVHGAITPPAFALWGSGSVQQRLAREVAQAARDAERAAAAIAARNRSVVRAQRRAAEINGHRQMLQQVVVARTANRPATPAAIAAMPRIIFSPAIHPEECVVCQERFETAEELRQMPCGHIFHGDCILPWLATSSSCPTCRHQLPSGPEVVIRRSEAPVTVQSIPVTVALNSYPVLVRELSPQQSQINRQILNRPRICYPNQSGVGRRGLATDVWSFVASPVSRLWQVMATKVLGGKEAPRVVWEGDDEEGGWWFG